MDGLGKSKGVTSISILSINTHQPIEDEWHTYWSWLYDGYFLHPLNNRLELLSSLPWYYVPNDRNYAKCWQSTFNVDRTSTQFIQTRICSTRNEVYKIPWNNIDFQKYLTCIKDVAQSNLGNASPGAPVGPLTFSEIKGSPEDLSTFHICISH